MADEIKQENREEHSPGKAPGGLPEDAMTEEEDFDLNDQPFSKSPEEIAAEQAMLAEMEASSTENADGESGQAAKQPSVVDSMQNLDLLMDVSLMITVELGRKEIRFGDVLQLGKGSLVELNKIADEPVDIYVNQSKIAEGEVVVVDDHFGVRITKLISTERLKKFR